MTARVDYFTQDGDVWCVAECPNVGGGAVCGGDLAIRKIANGRWSLPYRCRLCYVVVAHDTTLRAALIEAGERAIRNYEPAAEEAATPVADDNAPSHGDRHPAALCFHALNNALTVLTLTATCDAHAVIRLVGEAIEHLGAFNLLFERQERTIEEQRVETIREHRYSDRVEEKNSELVQSVITLTRQLDDAHAVIEQIRGGALTHTTPRSVAAGDTQ